MNCMEKTTWRRMKLWQAIWHSIWAPWKQIHWQRIMVCFPLLVAIEWHSLYTLLYMAFLCSSPLNYSLNKTEQKLLLLVVWLFIFFYGKTKMSIVDGRIQFRFLLAVIPAKKYKPTMSILGCCQFFHA